MPITIQASAIANAPRDAVWEVIADFSNVADYTDTVKSSSTVGERSFGVGASRRCELAPIGALEERIVEFTPGERLVISVYKARGLPMKESETTFSLTEIDASTTQLTMSAEVQAKGGFLAGLIERRLRSRLPAGAEKTVQDFAASAEKLARTTAKS